MVRRNCLSLVGFMINQIERRLVCCGATGVPRLGWAAGSRSARKRWAVSTVLWLLACKPPGQCDSSYLGAHQAD
jgi:hypothetical protein